MRDPNYVRLHKSKSTCTLGINQFPRCARLCYKRRDYKNNLFGSKVAEENATLGEVEWEIQSPKEFMTNDVYVYSICCCGL